MNTKKTLKVCGSVVKKESLVYLKENILASTTVLEADQPYPNYYGQIPKKTAPNSLFLITEREYSLEEALRFTQNIDICASKKVNAASAVIYSSGYRIPAIRIRNFPDYNHIGRLQECYQAQGVVFAKRKIPEANPSIKVNKCFTLQIAGNGFFLDLDEPREGYIAWSQYPEVQEFEEIIRNIRNNLNYQLFDAAYGSFIIDGKVMNMIRIYTEHLTPDLLKNIRDESVKWIKSPVKLQHLQGIE